MKFEVFKGSKNFVFLFTFIVIGNFFSYIYSIFAKSMIGGTMLTLKRIQRTMIENDRANRIGMQRKPPFQLLLPQVRQAFLPNAEKPDLNPGLFFFKLSILFFCSPKV